MIRIRRDPRRGERERMVESQIEARGIRGKRLLEAMRSVPREDFVEPADLPHAFHDGPFPSATARRSPSRTSSLT